MSSASGPLGLPFALGDDSAGAPLAAAAPSQPMEWISFSGVLGDSAVLFVQSVQRVALQQNRIRDDEWVAQYASACFADSAMEWYLGLDEETQSSWRRLRIALVQRFPTRAPVQPTLGGTSSSPTSSSATDSTDIGRIEIIRPGLGGFLGYLSQDSAGAFVINPNPERALRLQKVLHTDSQNQHERIYSLKLLNAPDGRFPFLGLKLSKLPGEDIHILPPTGSILWDFNVSSPPCCKANPYCNFKGYRNQSLFAAWSFAQTTESWLGDYYMRSAQAADGIARAVSAVWTMGAGTMPERVNDVEGLGMVWPVGDESNPNQIYNIGLEAVVHQGGVEGLHVHGDGFTKGSSNYLAEFRVSLLFKHIPGT